MSAGAGGKWRVTSGEWRDHDFEQTEGNDLLGLFVCCAEQMNTLYYGNKLVCDNRDVTAEFEDELEERSASANGNQKK